MSDMTIADCAAPLWDAGCRVEWDSENKPHPLLCYLSYSPKACGWGLDIVEHPYGDDERFDASELHDHLPARVAAVLLLSQAEMEIAEQCDNYCLSAPSDECKQDKWEIEMFVRARNDFCVVEAATKHEVKVAAYLAMKGEEGC